MVPADFRGTVRRAYVRTHPDHMAALCDLAGARTDDLYLLQPPPQRVRAKAFLDFSAFSAPCAAQSLSVEKLFRFSQRPVLLGFQSLHHFLRKPVQQLD